MKAQRIWFSEPADLADWFVPSTIEWTVFRERWPFGPLVFVPRSDWPATFPPREEPPHAR